MKYREAYKIGTKCEGSIQCTYATIYNEQGKALFSLQRRDAILGVNYRGGYSNESTTSDMIMVKMTDSVWFGQGITAGDADIRGGINIDIPLVVIDKISDERLVPAKLLPEAVEIIDQALEKMPRVRKYTIYKVYKSKPVYSGGEVIQEQREPEIVHVQYHLTQDNELYWANKETDSYYYEIEEEMVINPRYQELINVLDREQTIYIKPAAFNWMPVDLNNASVVIDGKELSLSACRDELEKAKKLLLASGTTLIF